MAKITTADLEKYYREQVEIKQSTTKAAKQIVYPIVNRLLTELNKQDDRLPTTLPGSARVGSHFQNLKVSQPNEFDFSVPIQGLPAENNWPPGSPRHETRWYRYEPDVSKNFATMPDQASLVPSRGQALPPPVKGYMIVPATGGEIVEKDSRQPAQRRLIYEGHIIPYQTKLMFKKALQAAIRNISSEGKSVMFIVSTGIII